MTQPLAIYIHWPFCKSKCPYCDFNSHVAASIDHNAWRNAYKREIAHIAAQTQGRVITSVFFGGGTPSLMEPQTVETVLSEIAKHWNLSNDIEITLEANPTSIEIDKFKGFHDAGINRVSVGIQSLNDNDLKALGREHSAEEARKALSIAQDVFDRTSFDLIYAREGQSLSDWEDELREAISLCKGHLSVYQLTIEPGTAFHTRHKRGDLKIPDTDMAADFYDLTQQILNAQNMPAYEISNHAVAGQESRHNLTYWTYGDYAGVGPGAHGRLTIDGQKFATRTHRAPALWMERVMNTGQGEHEREHISQAEQADEYLMMGLRLKSGVDLKRFTEVTGLVLGNHINNDAFETLCAQNFLTLKGNKLIATDQGRLCLESLLAKLLA